MEVGIFGDQPFWVVLLVTFLLIYTVTWILGYFTRIPYNWNGRHVFITGGSEGLGLEFAKILLKRRKPKAITLFSRSKAKLETAKSELVKLQKVDVHINIVTGDVGKEDQVEVAMQKARSESGPIHVVLAAAGMSIPKYFEDLTVEDYAMQMNVNFMGVVNTAKKFLVPSTQDEDRKFIAVNSIAGSVPFIGYAGYAPTKAAGRAFVDVLRNEFRDVKKTSIHICFPPDMDTPGFARENETKPLETKKVWPEMFNAVFKPEDVVASILTDVESNRYFLQSPDFFGNLLVSRAWGHYPRNFFLLETAIAPIFVFLHAGMVWMADSCVLKYKHHSKRT